MSAGSSEGTQPSTINSCPSCQCSGNSSSGWILPFFRIARIIGPPFFHQAIWSSPREVDGQLRVFGLLVLHRGDVPQRGVPALAVVEHLDVLDDGCPRLRPRGEGGAVDQLLLERGEEAFHGGIVPAVGTAAHAAGDPVPCQERLVMGAGV